MNSNKTIEKKLVTPILMDCNYEENARGRKVIGIHICSEENISLWKRWGDGYQRLEYEWQSEHNNRGNDSIS
jgi:hypothetical protein